MKILKNHKIRLGAGLALGAVLLSTMPSALAVQVLEKDKPHNKHKICLNLEGMSPDMQTFFYDELKENHSHVRVVPLSDLLGTKLSEISISLSNEARLERLLLNVYERLHCEYPPRTGADCTDPQQREQSLGADRSHDGDVLPPKALKAVSKACTKDSILRACVQAYNIHYTQALAEGEGAPTCKAGAKS